MVTVAWFSGTGNAADAAKAVGRTLGEAGIDWRLVSIEAGELPPSDTGALVLVFPVYAWSPPAIVLRWIRRLPRVVGSGRSSEASVGAGATAPTGTGVPAGVLAVDGGEGAGAAEHAGRALSRRGYTVRLTARSGYPVNWRAMSRPPSGEGAAEVFEDGHEGAIAFARAWVSGAESRYRRPVLGVLGSIAGFGFRSAGRRILSQCFVADDRCNGCGLCRRTCPVGAISLAEGEGCKPRWSVSCESCNRCINICPQNAIGTSWGRTIVAVGLSIGLVVLGAVAGARGFDRLVSASRSLTAGDGAAALDGAGGWRAVVRPLSVILGAAFGQLVYLFAAAPLVQWFLRLPGIKRISPRPFNADWPRYLAQGFRPPEVTAKRADKAGGS